MLEANAALGVVDALNDLMRECWNTADITPRSCGWAAAPGK